MSYLTRDLLPLALSRASGESVVLITKQVVAEGDGSYSVTPAETTALARVVALTSSEIQRLQDKGITVNQGFSISIPSELSKAPDQVVRADGSVLKVVRYTIEEGASVMIADMPAYGPAVDE